MRSTGSEYWTHCSAYKELHGNLEVHSRVRGAVRGAVARGRVGINLGKRVSAIRIHENYVKDRPDRVAELNRMGFIWDFYEEQWQPILKSMHAYKELHGDLKVPESSRCRQRRRGPRMRGASTPALGWPPSATRRITSRAGRTGSRS